MGFLTAIFSGGIATKVALIALVVLIGLATGWIAFKEIETARLNSEIKTLQKEVNALDVDNKILEENNKVLTDNMKKLAVANLANYNTAKQLLDERSKAQTAITNLAIANRMSRESLDRLNKKIDEMLKDPANDGPVAPVLREVIREIQRERARL